ncbi:MAG: hypothetical protein U0X20_02010 [Caldilineaceae bacterium]
MLSLHAYNEQRRQTVRDGFALGIDNLVASGKLDRASAMDELADLLHDGPSPKAEEMLHKLQQNMH